ncbi:MAG: heme-binding protein [Spirochaetia bacterium]|nr:heme-binding protein [Spirochaetia bacterium]
MAEIIAPEEVKFILRRSCYDCHSYQTKYPFYSYVFPISILINNHINEGREELNFSEFESLTLNKQSSKLRSIVEEIEENEMPLFGYTVMHRDAILSPEEKEVLISWAKSRGGNSEDDDN